MLSLPIKMLISSGISLTDKITLQTNPQNNVLPAIWVSLSPVKLIHKIIIITAFALNMLQFIKRFIWNEQLALTDVPILAFVIRGAYKTLHTKS